MNIFLLLDFLLQFSNSDGELFLELVDVQFLLVVVLLLTHCQVYCCHHQQLAGRQ